MTKPYHVQMTLDGHIDLVDNVTGREYDGWIDDSDPEPIRDGWTEFDVFPGETLTEYGQARLEDGEPDHHDVEYYVFYEYTNMGRATVKAQSPEEAREKWAMGYNEFDDPDVSVGDEIVVEIKEVPSR